VLVRLDHLAALLKTRITASQPSLSYRRTEITRSMLPLELKILISSEREIKHWEIIADNFSKAGWSWGCVSAVERDRRTIFIADAHRAGG
jgi:hypothetical protein